MWSSEINAVLRARAGLISDGQRLGPKHIANYLTRRPSDELLAEHSGKPANLVGGLVTLGVFERSPEERWSRPIELAFEIEGESSPLIPVTRWNHRAKGREKERMVELVPAGPVRPMLPLDEAISGLAVSTQSVLASLDSEDGLLDVYDSGSWDECAWLPPSRWKPLVEVQGRAAFALQLVAGLYLWGNGSLSDHPNVAWDDAMLIIRAAADVGAAALGDCSIRVVEKASPPFVIVANGH